MKEGSIIKLLDLRKAEEDIFEPKILGIITHISDDKKCIITDLGYQIEVEQ